MYRFILLTLFWLLPSLAVSNDLSIKAKVSSLSSYDSYLIYEKKRKEFNKNQKNFLKLRKSNLKEKIKREAGQKSAYWLDFLNNIQTNLLETRKSLTPSGKLSEQEKAFFVYQKKQQAFDKQRVSAFLNYKQRYRKYQKIQKETLSLRLKSLSAFRDKKSDNQIPIF